MSIRRCARSPAARCRFRACEDDTGLFDAGVRSRRKAEGSIDAEELDKHADVLPETVHEPAVAATRACSADVSLDQGDVQLRIRLLEVVRGPQSSIDTTDDRDVRPDLASERLSRLPWIGLEGFSQPPISGRLRGPSRSSKPDRPRLVFPLYSCSASMESGPRSYF